MLAANLLMSLWSASGHSDETEISMDDLSAMNHEIIQKFTPQPVTKPLFSPLNATLSSEQLLEVSQNVSLYYAPNMQSFANDIVLLPLDTNHLYAYWSVGDVQQFKRLLEAHSLVLRINAAMVAEAENALHQLSAPCYEAVIESGQSRQVIDMSGCYGGVFSACIGCYVNSDDFVPLFHSNDTEIDPQAYTELTGLYQDVASNVANDHIADKALVDTTEQGSKDAVQHAHYASHNYSGQGK